jgi:hypothetical protein
MRALALQFGARRKMPTRGCCRRGLAGRGAVSAQNNSEERTTLREVSMSEREAHERCGIDGPMRRARHPGAH